MYLGRGIFQALCDCYLGAQYYMFGDGGGHGGIAGPMGNGELKAKMSMDIGNTQGDQQEEGIELSGWQSNEKA